MNIRKTIAPGLLALTLGAAYGIAVVSGLLEIQRIATPDELAGLNGVYYSLAYIGFLIPSVLAALNEWLSYPALLGIDTPFTVGPATDATTTATKAAPPRRSAGPAGCDWFTSPAAGGEAGRRGLSL